jgi:hypothetical protein
MHILSAGKQRITLDLVTKPPAEFSAVQPAGAGPGAFAETSSVARASRAFFEIGRLAGKRAVPEAKPGPPPAVFRERATGLVRTVYHEIVLRFHAKVPDRRRRQILSTHRFEGRRTNPFIPDQVVVAHAAKRRAGADLLDVANDWSAMDEVVFATPNFVSEFRRQATPAIPPAQWHLRNLGKVAGQKQGEDVDALDAWKITRGKRSVVIAVLDDGVDVEHPNLKARIWKNANPAARDRIGRDFFLPDDHPDHYNPRPKKFQFPCDQMTGNDIHGTPCAGVAAASGHGAYGIAPRCRVLAVKIFHGDDLAQDERVADAIRYSAQRADILSCSWSGAMSPDLELAI